ncbi:MAG: hypothetical protein H6716_29400 [Polyangiaceae bacterium]|nr:hypothetical protein [Polyangiaceae bacterium]
MHAMLYVPQDVSRWTLSLLCVVVAFAGCGARDALDLSAPDASRPGASIQVDCGPWIQYTAPRQTLELVGSATSQSPIVALLMPGSLGALAGPGGAYQDHSHGVARCCLLGSAELPRWPSTMDGRVGEIRTHRQSRQA